MADMKASGPDRGRGLRGFEPDREKVDERASKDDPAIEHPFSIPGSVFSGANEENGILPRSNTGEVGSPTFPTRGNKRIGSPDSMITQPKQHNKLNELVAENERLVKLLLSLIDAETHKDFEDYFGNSGEIGSAAVQLRKRSKGQEVKVDGDNDDGSGPTHRSAGVSTAKFVGQKQILSEKNKKLMSFVRSIKGGKNDEGHDDIVKSLIDRGAVEGIVENSWDTKRMSIGAVIHDEPHLVLDLLFTESKSGVFRRHNLNQTAKGGESGSIYLWQHFIEGGTKVVEYLLFLRVITEDDSSSYTIKVRPMKEKDLNNQAAIRYEDLHSNKLQIQRAMIEGEIRISDLPHGQSALTCVGSLEADEIELSNTELPSPLHAYKLRTVAKHKLKNIKQKAKGVATFFSTSRSMHMKVDRREKGDVNVVFSSIKNLVKEVAKYFHQPDEIDHRMKDQFVEEIIPNAPELTSEEDGMIKGRHHLMKYTKRAKRVRESLMQDVEKFTYTRDDGSIWGVSFCTVDTAAAQVLAEIFVADTYESSRVHMEKEGDLPNKTFVNIDGTRSQLFVKGKKMLRPYEPRLCDCWMCWKKVEGDNGSVCYLCGLVPASEYQGTKGEVETEGAYTLAESTGIWVINEIAPMVCSLLRVQSADLKTLGIPKTILTKFAESNLKWDNDIQERYRRNAKIVDDELRGVLVEKMKQEVELSAEHQRMFKEIESFFSGKEEDWKVIELPVEGLKMEIKKKHDVKGSRRIGVGRAEGNVDCTAEEAAAWYFEYCGRQRTALDRAEKDVRLEIRKEGSEDNEKVFSSVKKLPYPLHRREFVFKKVWKRNGKDSISVLVSPVSDTVDYGGKVGRRHLVRGISRALFTATKIDSVGRVPQCKVSILLFLDAGGMIPRSVGFLKLRFSLLGIADLQNTFRRDKEVDDTNLASLAKIMKEVPQEYNPTEEAAIKVGKEFYRSCKDRDKLEQVKSPDDRVTVKIVKNGRSGVCGFCETIVDASLEECAAFDFLKDSRARSDITGRRFLKRKVWRENDHSQLFLTTRNLNLRGFFPREWKLRVIWHKESTDEVWIVYADTQDLDKEFPTSLGTTRASATTTWLFKKKPPIGNVPQTEVSFAIQVDLKGALSNIAMNKVTIGTVNNLMVMRKRFDKSKEIDAFNRRAIVVKIKKLKKANTETFAEIFKDVKDKERVRGAFPLSRTWLKVEGNGKGQGKTTVNVPASLEEVVAFFWDFESRVHHDTTGDVERVVQEKSQENWKMVVRRRQKLESAHGDNHSQREFLNVMELHRVARNTMVITMKPPKDWTEDLGSSMILSSSKSFMTDDCHEAAENVAIRFTKKSRCVTRVEFVTKLSLGGGVSRGATGVTLERHLDEAAEAERYFTDLIKLDDMTKEAGEALGADMVWDGGQLGGQHSRSEREKHMEEVCMDSAALREVVKKYPWFVTMLKRARLGELAINSSVKTKLECVDEKEARVIGNNLTPCLRSRKVVTAGVDLWKLQNRAVGELFKEFPWMEDMFVALGKGVVKTAPWGLMFRVSFGAFTSVLDLVTDIYVTIMFYKDAESLDGSYWYFQASVASLALSIFAQLAFVYMQHRGVGWQAVLRESGPVLIGLKPAVDAYRIASGKKQELGQASDPLTEMTVTKVIEAFAEAIPGAFIQLTAIVTHPHGASLAAWISLLISALTTGYAGATISYDYDTDPERRQHSPDFYGLVPADPRKRTITFITLVFFGAGMLLMRCLSLVLLRLTRTRLIVGFLAGDLLFFFFVKIFRRDFWYWAPIGGRRSEFIVSFVTRLIGKVVSDFTSVIQFRNPYELGGLYWTFSLFVTLVGVPVAISVYEEHATEQKGVVDLAWKLYIGLISATLATFVVFYMNVEKGYLYTFFSLETGRESITRRFREARDDATKARCILDVSEKLWSQIEEEIRAWVALNWVNWEEEKPRWLTDIRKERIPMRFIPSERERLLETSRRKIARLISKEKALKKNDQSQLRLSSLEDNAEDDLVNVFGSQPSTSSTSRSSIERGDSSKAKDVRFT